MIRRYRVHILVAALVTGAAFMVYCSGNTPTSLMQNSSSSQSTPATGSVVVLGGDAPVCDVLSFKVTIQSATMTPAGGGTPVSVLPVGPGVSVDFAKLMDFATVLNFANVPAGEYSSLTLALTNPQLTVLDDTQTPPVATALPATLSSTAFSIPIQPSLAVTSNSAVGLRIDFDLLKSVVTDANGQVTGQVHPVFTSGSSTAGGPDGLGEVERLSGLVQSVQTTSSNTAYTGSFTVAHSDGTPPTTVYTTSATQILFAAAEAGGLKSLAAGVYVEIDAYVDASGNLVAKTVISELEENAAEHQSAFVGLVTSVARDAAGAATQFTLFVADEEPDESAMVAMHSALTVNISDSTQFKITPVGLNEANLEFDPTTLGAGQAVVVHAKAQPAAGAGASAANPAPVTAEAIYLRLRSVVGNFKAMLSPNSNGSGGAFSLTTCGSLFQNRPITVVTFADTAFAGVSGLSALTTQPTLVVKGLLFYASHPMTVEGVSVSSPGWVLEAKEVHQLSP